MPNTPEDIAKAKDAFGLLFTKYGEWLNGPKLNHFLGADMNQVFKFMPEGPFLANHALTSRVRSGCSVLGFCAIEGIQPVVYINTDKATPSTIIHELLHHFTHSNFDVNVSAELNEAVTEYFTRKLVAHADAKVGAAIQDYIDRLEQTGNADDLMGDPRFLTGLRLNGFVVPQRQSYEKEHAKLVNATKLGKQFDPAWGVRPDPTKKPGVVKRAYFKGELTAINLLKDAFF